MNIRNIRNIHVFKSIIKGVLFMNPYAEVLKQLLQYTETKYTTLSQAIDYDMSYISKWVNGARLPASRHADRIHGTWPASLPTRPRNSTRRDLKRIFSLPTTARIWPSISTTCWAVPTARPRPGRGKSESRDQAIHFYAGRV